jgi:hypothetical protein
LILLIEPQEANVPLAPIEIPKIFHVRFPMANLSSRDVGQINFSTEEKGYTFLMFLMPRSDFARLGKRITLLLVSESLEDLPPE